MKDVTGKGILIVDDDPDILDSLKTMLEATLPGVHVITAETGAIALDLLKTESVQLIITDFRMPGMNGAQFLSKADIVAPGVPRILISAFPEAILNDQVVDQLKVECFLPKPLDAKQVIELSRRLLELL